MNNLFVGLVVGLVFYLIPSASLCFLIKKITKRKISKGWCVLVFLFLALLCDVICLLVDINISRYGTFWRYLYYGAIISAITEIIYDKTIPSILDTEKELKAKRQANKEI